MAKVAFTKLSQIKTINPVACVIDENTISVTQYLPLERKVELMQRIIEQSGNNEEGFYNIVKLNVYYVIEMLRAYTNISFTDAQMNNIEKLYDSIVLNKIWETISGYIPPQEREYIWENTCALAREITNYNHSIMGVLKLARKDYSDTDFNIANLMNQIKDPESLGLIKEILPLADA